MADINPPTRFLIMSDTHDLDISSLPNLPRADVVLHCGDITENGDLEGYKQTIKALAALNTELKLVIAGNHDISLDVDFYKSQGGEPEVCDTAYSIWTSDICKQQGIHYLNEGMHTFTLSTGITFTIYASPYTPSYGISAFQYRTHEDRYSRLGPKTPAWAKCTATDISAIPDHPDVDIMMTHGPPRYILDNTQDGNSAGCEHLRRAVERARPALHCFGHIHAGWGSQNVAWRSQLSAEEIDDLELTQGYQDEAIKLPATFGKRTKA